MEMKKKEGTHDRLIRGAVGALSLPFGILTLRTTAAPALTVGALGV